MKRGFAAVVSVAMVVLAACTAPGQASSSPAAPHPPSPTSASPTPATPTPTAPPSPAVPALGAWAASCTSADADAAALAQNILSQDAFRGEVTPSALPGWPEALRTAVQPLDACPTAHLLAVADAVTFGADAQAGREASDRVVGLTRGRTLVLSGSQIGRLTVATRQSEAEPVLRAIMGAATASTQSCEASGQAWNVLQWGDFRVTFLKAGTGAVLDGWSITPKGSTASNLKLQDDLPVRATFAQLKAFNSGLTQVDVFGTGAGPWVAEVRPNLRYHWTERNAQSFRVEGGELRVCE